MCFFLCLGGRKRSVGLSKLPVVNNFVMAAGCSSLAAGVLLRAVFRTGNAHLALPFGELGWEKTDGQPYRFLGRPLCHLLTSLNAHFERAGTNSVCICSISYYLSRASYSGSYSNIWLFGMVSLCLSPRPLLIFLLELMMILETTVCKTSHFRVHRFLHLGRLSC